MYYLEINIYEYPTQIFLGQRYLINHICKFSAKEINNQIDEFRKLNENKKVFFKTNVRV